VLTYWKLLIGLVSATAGRESEARVRLILLLDSPWR